MESLVHVNDVLGYLYMAFWRFREKEPGSTSSIEECLILVPEYRHLHLVHVKLCLFEPETAEMTEKYYAFTGNAHRFLMFDCILL